MGLVICLHKNSVEANASRLYENTVFFVRAIFSVSFPISLQRNRYWYWRRNYKLGFTISSEISIKCVSFYPCGACCRCVLWAPVGWQWEAVLLRCQAQPQVLDLRAADLSLGYHCAGERMSGLGLVPGGDTGDINCLEANLEVSMSLVTWVHAWYQDVLFLICTSSESCGFALTFSEVRCMFLSIMLPKNFNSSWWGCLEAMPTHFLRGGCECSSARKQVLHSTGLLPTLGGDIKCPGVTLSYIPLTKLSLLQDFAECLDFLVVTSMFPCLFAEKSW